MFTYFCFVSFESCIIWSKYSSIAINIRYGHIITCYFRVDTSTYPGGTHIGKWYGYVPRSWPFFQASRRSLNLSSMCRSCAPGGALNFISGRGVRPGFPKCGACELTFASEKGGLWVENFQIWGLVSWKFPNLGACELKISKFGGLWAKIWVEIEAVEAKISKFSQKGVLWTDSLAWNGTLASGRRGVKRGSSGPHIPIPPF